MKKLLLAVGLLGLVASASAAPLQLSISFNGDYVIAPTTVGPIQPGGLVFTDPFTITSISCVSGCVSVSSFLFNTGLEIGDNNPEFFDFQIDFGSGDELVFFDADGGFTILQAGANTHVVDLTGVLYLASDQIGTANSATLTFQWSGVRSGNQSFSGSLVTSDVVPEPSSMALLGCSLVGLGLVARRRRKK